MSDAPFNDAGEPYMTAAQWSYANDMASKNRSLYGERSKTHKYSFDDVKEMKRLRKEENLTYKKVAKIFNGNASYISEIIREKRRVKG